MKNTSLSLVCFLLCSLFVSAKNIDSPVFESDSSSIKKCISLYEKANNSFNSADYQKAILYSDSCLSIAEKHELVEEKRNAHNLKAISYMRLGDLDNSYTHQNIAYQLAKKANRKFDIAMSLNNFGTIYRMWGKYDLSIQKHFESLSLAKDIKSDKIEYMAHGNIGNVYYLMGDYDQCIHHFSKAIEICERSGDTTTMLILNVNIGNIYLSTGDYQKALNYYHTSLELNKSVNNTSFLGDIYNNIGLIHQEQKEYPEALIFHKKSLAIKLDMHELNGIVNSHKNISDCYLFVQQFDSAEKYLQAGIEHAKKLNNLQLLSEFYLSQSSLDSINGNYLKSMQHLKLHMSYKDSLNANARNEVIEELKTKYQTEQKENEIQILTKSKQIQELEIKNTKSALNTQMLLAKQQEQELEIINKEKNLQTLQLELSSEEINRKKLENQIQKDELSLKTLENEMLEQKAADEKFAKLLIVFISISILLILSVLYFFYRNKQKADYNFQLANMELKALKAQMNPHFIFNALNAVDNYIFTNQNRKASEFLTKFSKLIRNILNHSYFDEISLEDEIQSLQVYLDLQVENYNQSFSYALLVEKDLQSDEISVPPLLIQPFIENAIIHGILPLKEKGHISIEISTKNNLLIFNIKDNGIGRKKSNEIKKNNVYKTESFGLKISKKRIELLKQKHINSSIQFIDLSQGLQVIISIPLKPFA